MLKKNTVKSIIVPLKPSNMSAHFIPFQMFDNDGSDAWFGGINGYHAGIRAWYALVATLDHNTDLYKELNTVQGWVHPERIKEFADHIRDIDITTLPIKKDEYFFDDVDVEVQKQGIRTCAARLKEVILDCAEKGRGILHFN